MITGFPLYHYFHCGNAYSSEEGGMRYIISPGKKPDPADETGKKKLEFLSVTVWPGPWSMEHTAEEKFQQAEFAGNQQGLDEAAAWLLQCYQQTPERWVNLPSLLDCEPDR